MTEVTEVVIPVLVRTRQTSKIVSIYSPDLHTTVHGRDYTSAWAEAQVKLGAIYFYAYERNIKYKIKTDLSEVTKLCNVSGDFPTYMTITSA